MGAKQLPSEAFSGVLLRRKPEMQDIFIANDLFLDFMQTAIADIGPKLPQLQAAAREARRQRAPSIVVYDARIKSWLRDNPQGTPETEEAIGVFAHRNGEITGDCYHKNMGYSCWTLRGPTRIPADLYGPMLEELRRRDHVTSSFPWHR